MNLIIIIGSGAVGKMTVGQELQKITDFRLFHNHMLTEDVFELFGGMNGALISKLREDVFDEFIKSGFDGLIFTYMMAFDIPSEWEYLEYLTKKFEKSGGTVYYVELVADQAERLKRNGTENRLKNKPSKRDVALSDNRLKMEDMNYRLVSNEGEIKHPNYIRIDNTNMSPEEAAKVIKNKLNLGDYTGIDKLNHIYLREVREELLPTLLEMQKASFLPLYAKYKDDMSPALESIDDIKRRFSDSSRKYYFICKDGARIGAVNIGIYEKTGRISPLFIIPEYQNQGLGQLAMRRIFLSFPDINKWTLDTIKEEEGNCHLYSKMGFVRVGDEHIINPRMTLVDYVKDI